MKKQQFVEPPMLPYKQKKMLFFVKKKLMFLLYVIVLPIFVHAHVKGKILI